MRWLIPVLLAFTFLPFILLGKYSGSEFYTDVSHYADGVGNRTVQQVLQKQWHTDVVSNINIGFSDQSHWFYFELPDGLLQLNEPVIVEIDFPTIDYLSLYLIDQNDRVVERYHTGAALPFNTRPIWSENFVFALRADAHANRVLIKAQTSNALQMPIMLYSKSEFLKKEEWSLMLWGGYYGVMLIMVVYSLFNGVIMKELLFFYYSAYALSTALIMAALNGHGFAYLWPTVPGLNNISIALFTCLATGFGTAFAMKFLRVDQLRRNYAFAGGFVIFISAIVVLLSLATFSDYSFEATMVALLFALVVLATAFSAIMNRYFLGWYFLAGWTVFLLSIGAFSLTILGVLPANLLTHHSKEVGSVIEIILFSLGLSAIYNREKDERHRIHKALDSMKERLKSRVNLVNDKSGFLEIPQLSKHLQDIRSMDRRIHSQMGRILVVSVMVIDKVTLRPDYIALGDCLRELFNSRITVFPFKTATEGLPGDITVLLFPLHNKFEAEGIIERVENWSFALGEHYDLHFGYAISHLTEKYDVNYIEESFHYLEEAVQKKSMSYSIDDTLSFIHR
ncbi:MAG: hypothetical protein MI808_17070 [Pseudomonadales bacterium]|nr:hypothetical protein [Pseudomonadales bacterium]